MFLIMKDIWEMHYYKNIYNRSITICEKENKGECAKYYIENSNVAIISKETFNAVKELQKGEVYNI